MLPRPGDAALVDLDGRRLTRLYQQLLRAGGRERRPLSIRTVRYVHAILHKALGDAVRDGLLPANPSDRATIPAIRSGWWPPPQGCAAASCSASPGTWSSPAGAACP